MNICRQIRSLSREALASQVGVMTWRDGTELWDQKRVSRLSVRRLTISWQNGESRAPSLPLEAS